MKFWMILILLTSITVQASGTSSKDVLEETVYQNFKYKILNESNKSLSLVALSPFEQSLFVDALWDAADEGNPEVLDQVQDEYLFTYDLQERLRVGILRIRYHRASSLPQDLVSELLNLLLKPDVDTKIIYTLAAYETDLLNAGHADIIALAKNHPAYYDIAQSEDRKKEITDDIVADLFNNNPDVTTYMNGEYVQSVKIFKFCRENRLYPCLMVMKNIHGEIVRNEDGSIWTHKSLASSAHGLPSYVRNGNTPTGIFTIDSVMPVADAQISFGKFRRMILNFVPKSKNEVLFKSLLPASSHESDWWQAAVTARDMGRNLFRIHGTGRINNDPETPYYPFMRTSGCIAQRENTYDGIVYHDQRDLLDAIMKAMDLEPSFDNEPKVKGILYIMEIDDKNEAVEAADLALRGIE